MIVWWKHKNVIFETANMKEAGVLDHSLYPQYRMSYGGYDGQMRLWIGNP